MTALAAADRPCAEPVAAGLSLPGWPADAVHAWVVRERRRLFGDAPLDGEVLLMPLANSPWDVLALLAAWSAGACPAIVEPASTDAERSRAMAQTGARRTLLAGECPELVGAVGERQGPPGGVLLPTSGSTGAAKWVERSAASLGDEGKRYAELLGLPAGARILLAAPLCHAYALGWLCGALQGGWCVIAEAPRSLGAIAARMRENVAWTALTPSIARLLAARGRGGTKAIRGRVMAGAGPVTAELDAAFEAAFGRGLGRNYGSSETGALFASTEACAPACVGSPMPGVSWRIVGETGHELPAGEVGALNIRLREGWHAMGDLAVSDRLGRLTIVGRRSHALRCGERWIAPGEIEDPLRAYPEMREVRVTGADVPGTDELKIVADLWPVDPSRFDPQAFREFAEQRLQLAMRPQRLRVHALLERSAGAKPTAAPRWRRGDAGSLAETARAYKRAELLFALDQLGVLARLDGTQDGAAIAEELGLDAGVIETLLAVAARYGIVQPGETGAGEAEVESLVAFEALASVGAVTRGRIAQVAREGWGAAAPEPLPPDFLARYLGAMNGSAQRFRTRLGLRLLDLAAGAHLLEVAPSAGLYGSEAAAAGLPLSHRFQAVGPGADGDAWAADLTARDGSMDAVVIRNGLRYPPVVERLADLARLLRPAGTLLIDELFLTDEAASADFAVDWLTHGGTCLLTSAELLDHLAGLGLDAAERRVPGIPGARMVVARAPKGMKEAARG
jgi:acyl-CoA synthetase (AMP-forming)/AMP-acid ligase II